MTDDLAAQLHRALSALHSAMHSGEPCSPQLHALVLEAMAADVSARLAALSGEHSAPTAEHTHRRAAHRLHCLYCGAPMEKRKHRAALSGEHSDD